MTELERQLLDACEAGMMMRALQVAYFKNRNAPDRIDRLREAKTAESKYDTVNAAAIRAARAMGEGSR